MYIYIYILLIHLRRRAGASDHNIYYQNNLMPCSLTHIILRCLTVLYRKLDKSRLSPKNIEAVKQPTTLSRSLLIN